MNTRLPFPENTAPPRSNDLVGAQGRDLLRAVAQTLQHLSAEGFTPTEEQLAKLHNPVGLDIGAETAEEIAISIVSEIQAIINNRSGSFLKDRRGPIH